MRYSLSIMLGASALGLLATPALAQDGGGPGQNGVPAGTDLYRDTITVGGGIATVPSYEGSDHNRIIPAAAARGSIDGFAFSTRGPRLYVDLIRDEPGPVLDFELGPVVGVGLNRTSHKSIDDDRVEALGTIKTAIELGGYVGIGKTGIITSDYDKLSVEVAYRHDVNSAYDSYVVTPQVSYGTPLSRKAYVGLSASADYAGRGYARTYFSVTPIGSLASGLPVFSADKGWKDWTVTGLVNYSITGDLLHGFSIAGGISYSRLLNDFAYSPVTRIAGDRGQFYGAVGLAYTF